MGDTRTSNQSLKISAAIIAWNEVDTIDLCLKSIAGFVDEVIIADTGSFDGTRKKANECLSELNLSGELIEVTAHTLGQARLSAIEKTTHDWLLLIDSNIVLSNAVKDELLSAQKRGFIGMIRSLNLMGDYNHYFTTLPFHSHHDTLFHKTMVTWKDDRDRPKPLARRIPLKRHAVNLSRVRPSWRYWVRGEAFYPETIHTMKTEGNRQNKWLETRKYRSILEYVQATEKMTLQDIERIAPEWYLDLLQRFARPLTTPLKRWLPEPIIEEQRNPRYSLIYQNGCIVGRCPSL